MKDLSAAIAAAREAIAEVERIKAEYKEEPFIKAFVLTDLLAALDAAQGEAVAWQVNAFGQCQKIVRREDVADELADSYRRSNYENVEIVPLCAAPHAPPAAVPAGEGEYAELLYAVESKWPGESRHETALRYIREREARTSSAAAQSALLAAALAGNKEHDNAN